MIDANFKDSPTITIMLSTMLKGKAPSDWSKSDWARYHSSFRPVKVSPHQMAVEIWRGHSFTPVFSSRRKEENFIEAHHMAFDFDNDGAALDFIMRSGTFADYFSSFAYSTPSSTEHHPKSRVVFIFETAVADAGQARKIYRAIAWRFLLDGSYCDPQCKDPLRLYYGSPSCKVVGNWSILPDDVIHQILAEYDQAHPPPVPVPTKQAAIPLAASPDFAMYHIKKTLDNLRYAAPGERHMKRRDISRAMGGYITAGHIGEAEAWDLLRTAAMQSTDDPALAEREAREGMEYGKAEPLYIEWKPATQLGDML